MTKQELKDSVSEVIKTNGENEITGANLQEKLFEIIDECYGTGSGTASNLLFPNGVDIVTESRDWQTSDQGKLLVVLSDDLVQLTMPSGITFDATYSLGLIGINNVEFQKSFGGPFIKGLSQINSGQDLGEHDAEVVFFSAFPEADGGNSILVPLSTSIINDNGQFKTMLKYLYDRPSGGLFPNGFEQIEDNREFNSNDVGKILFLNSAYKLSMPEVFPFNDGDIVGIWFGSNEAEIELTFDSPSLFGQEPTEILILNASTLFQKLQPISSLEHYDETDDKYKTSTRYFMDHLGGGTTPDLQEVTDVGNRTTNNIHIVTGSDDSVVRLINDDGDGVIEVNNNAGNNRIILQSVGAYIDIFNNGNVVELRTDNIVGDHTQQLPNSDGVLVTKVNGFTSNNNGEVIINGLLFPNGVKIVDSSRDLSIDDKDYILFVIQPDVILTMPDPIPFSEGDRIGFVSDYTDVRIQYDLSGNSLYSFNSPATSEVVILQAAITGDGLKLVSFGGTVVDDGVLKTATRYLMDHQSSGGGSSLNLNEIGFGTGTGITSSNLLSFDPTKRNLISGNNTISYGNDSIILGGYNNDINAGGIQQGASIVSSIQSSIYQSNYSSIIGGFQNIINAAPGSSIISGIINNISGSSGYSSIIGGRNNNINTITIYSSIINGKDNSIAETNYSSIIGGKETTITNSNYSGTIVGQGHNMNDVNSSIISGGDSNEITLSTQTSISGGSNNKVYKQFASSITGGQTNLIGATSGNQGYNNSIVGGNRNSIKPITNDDYFNDNSIIGGYYNIISGYVKRSSILGGGYNSITNGSYNGVIGYRNIVINGSGNFVSGEANVINPGSVDNSISGSGNIIYNSQRSLLSGFINIITDSTESSILGGKINSITQSLSSIIFGGEFSKIINSETSMIFGGHGVSSDVNYGTSSGNMIVGSTNSIVSGGYIHLNPDNFYTTNYPNSIINSNSSMVLSGFDNKLDTSPNSSILGGIHNTLLSTNNASILGGRSNFLGTGSEVSMIIGGNGNTLEVAQYSGIFTGQGNNLGNGIYSSIIGGHQNTVFGSNGSTIIGGAYNSITYCPYSSIIGGENLILNNESHTVLVPNLKVNNLTTAADDIEITDFTKGVVLRDSSGGRWRITVNTLGVLITTSI